MRRITLLLVSILVFGAAQAQLSIEVGDSVICAGDTTWLTASGADVYEWTSAKLDTNIGDSVNFISTAADGDTFDITVVGFDTVAMDTDTVFLSVVVHALPVVTVTSSAATSNNFVCIGDSATLTASGSASIISYLWSPDSSLSNDTSMVVVAKPTTATDYIVTVTDTNGCIRISTPQPVNVNISNPIIGLTAVDTILCPGQNTVLSASSASATFEWSPSNSLSSATGSTVTATPTTTTTYTVTATANGCDTFRSVTIEVLPIPSMSFTRNPTTPVCLDGTVFIDIDCAECEYYRWEFPNSTLETQLDTVTVSPNSPGANTITVYGFGANGCPVIETIVINVDSCFDGTPFGISDVADRQSRVFVTGSQLSVQSSGIVHEVRVFNVAGQQVYAETGSSNTASIDAEHLEAGIYIVLVHTGEAVESHKLFIP